MKNNELWTPEEVSAFLRVPIGTLYSWRNRGVGPRTIKVGRFVRYDRADLDAYLQANCDAGGEEAA